MKKRTFCPQSITFNSFLKQDNMHYSFIVKSKHSHSEEVWKSSMTLFFCYFLSTWSYIYLFPPRFYTGKTADMNQPWHEKKKMPSLTEKYLSFTRTWQQNLRLQCMSQKFKVFFWPKVSYIHIHKVVQLTLDCFLSLFEFYKFWIQIKLCSFFSKFVHGLCFMQLLSTSRHWNHFSSFMSQHHYFTDHQTPYLLI